MIGRFLSPGLWLIVSAVVSLAAENSAAPAATDAKQRPGFQTAQPASSIAPPASLTARPASTASPASAREGQHDFDWEFGKWRTHLWRLKQPLSGLNEWMEYDGTTVVRKIWDGRANLVELEVNGPTHIEALNLRLYNPETHKWSLNFASSKGGTLGTPTIGEFKNGRGEFYDQEDFNGRPVLVRFIISDIKPESCKFEQSFSTDGGKTWEVNWIAIDTRVKE